MRPWSMLMFATVVAVAAARPAVAQTEMIGFEKVQQLAASGQARLAARELNLASVAFRSEIGRCRDEGIGARLVELEPRFSALANRLVANGVTEAELKQEFVAMDRLLAENHMQLAVSGWGLRRFGRLDAVAGDLRLAAKYVVRSANWTHQAIPAELQKAVSDAITAADRLAASPDDPPPGTTAAIEALDKAMKAAR